MATAPPKFSRDPQKEGFLQLVAGLGFINSTGFMTWDPVASKLVMCDPAEKNWRDFDIAFGRAAFWNIFSTGAECLLKALYLSHGVEIRKTKKIIDLPINDPATLAAWIDEYINGSINIPEPLVNKSNAITFGTMGDLTKSDPYTDLMSKVKVLHPTVSPTEFKKKSDFLLATYRVLGTSIRNRDTHAYVPNVRETHSGLLSFMLLPAFVQIIQWLPKINGQPAEKEVSKIWTSRDKFVINQAEPFAKPLEVESTP